MGDHFGKIQVHGDDAPLIAARIIELLQRAPEREAGDRQEEIDALRKSLANEATQNLRLAIENRDLKKREAGVLTSLGVDVATAEIEQHFRPGYNEGAVTAGEIHMIRKTIIALLEHFDIWRRT